MSYVVMVFPIVAQSLTMEKLAKCLTSQSANVEEAPQGRLTFRVRN